LPLVSLTPVANLLLVSLIPFDFAAGIVDTGGKFATGISKFATGINDTSSTGGKIYHWYQQICHRYQRHQQYRGKN
jgi:hypothetical protein